MKKNLPAIPENLREIMRWDPEFHEREKAIRYHWGKTTEECLIVGCLLTQAKEKEDWKQENIANNFYEWTEKELHISQTSAFRLLDVWSTIRPFLEKYLEVILKADFTKLAMIMPPLKKLPDKAADLFHMASANSVRDLKNNVKQLMGGAPSDTCDHIRVEEGYVRCLRCNKIFKKVLNEGNQRVKSEPAIQEGRS